MKPRPPTASLRASRRLAKSWKHLSDAELLKSCAVDRALAPGKHQNVFERVNQEGAAVLEQNHEEGPRSEECFSLLLADLKKADDMSLPRRVLG